MAKEVGSWENCISHRIAKRWVSEGKRGRDKGHVFNEWIMGFDFCSFRSGLQLSFVLLSLLCCGLKTTRLHFYVSYGLGCSCACVAVKPRARKTVRRVRWTYGPTLQEKIIRSTLYLGPYMLGWGDHAF